MALFTPFAIAVATGAIFAVLWVNILWKFYKGEELAYVFTVGMLFTLHSLVEHVGGRGCPLEAVKPEFRIKKHPSPFPAGGGWPP